MLVLVMDAESSLEPCLEPKGSQEEEEAKHNEGEVTENSVEQAGHGKIVLYLTNLILKFVIMWYKYFCCLIFK